MKKVLRITAILLGGLIGLLMLAILGLTVYGQVKFKPRMANRPLYTITADTSPEGIARGEYLVRSAMACGDCHSAEGGSGPLSGTFETFSEGPISGVFAAPNLTPDPETGLGNWTDAEIARAIREGVDKDGVGLLVMPSFNYHIMSDADVAAIVGYLRSQEPVKNEIPPFQANTVGKVVAALGMMGPTSVGTPIEAPQTTPEKDTMEYGEYVMVLSGCRDCHGFDLGGGAIPFAEPGTPDAPSLNPSGRAAHWNEADFIQTMRTGLTPEGFNLNPEAMPWPVYGKMSDEDLASILMYMKTLPASTASK